MTADRQSRTKRRGLDWDAHHDRLKQMYLKEDKTLEEIRKKMSDDYSFHATYVLMSENAGQW
jgi:hypothetical protein